MKLNILPNEALNIKILVNQLEAPTLDNLLQGPNNENRVRNTHVVISSDGEIKATYDKSHLFDLDIKDKVRLCESDYTVPGSEIVPPVDTPVGWLGLATVSFRPGCEWCNFGTFSQSACQVVASLFANYVFKINEKLYSSWPTSRPSWK